MAGRTDDSESRLTGGLLEGVMIFTSRVNLPLREDFGNSAPQV
jgi:hypothetical protein